MYLDPSRKWRTAEWVRSQLLQCEELQALVDKKIFPLIAPENTMGDYIIVYRSSYGRERDKTGDTSSRAFVTVLCFSDSYDSSLELAELVDAVLDGGRNDDVGKLFAPGTTATLDSSEEGLSDGKLYQSLTFEIN
jgi:hypothetical protein bacD2_23394|nr:hypothetical protein [uncultured Porphyromonas sp.]DAN73249.1 MAG TPA: hypothetical protein [Caudoviricetes sp.]DAT50989.1 MAG TPA: hypothetical protein [Caudoviricetes sp.]